MTEPVLVPDVRSLALRTAEQPAYDWPCVLLFDAPFDVELLDPPDA